MREVEKALIQSSPDLKDSLRVHRVVSSMRENAEDMKRRLERNPDQQVFGFTRAQFAMLRATILRDAKLIVNLNEELHAAVELLEEVE